MDEVKPELVEFDTKSIKNAALHNEHGKFAVGNPGGPGRKGTLGKFTQMKLDLVKAWKTSEGKKRFLEMLNSKDPADFKWAVERIISILPKEQVIDTNDSGGPTVIFQFIKNEKVETIEIKKVNERGEQ
jgi:hypothetical protein